MTLIINRQILHILLLTCLILLGTNAIAQSFLASVYKDEKGMASNRITQIIQSRTGEIWMATQDGISTFDGLYWNTFSSDLPIPPVVGAVRMEVLEDSSIFVACANNDGFFISRYKNGIWKTIDPPSILKEEKFLHYRMSKAGNGWMPQLVIGAGDTLFTYRNNGWDSTPFPMNLPDEHLQSIISIGPDSILVTTNKGLYRHTPAGKETLLLSVDILNSTISKSDNGCYILYKDALAYYNLIENKLTFIFQNQPIVNYNTGNHSNIFVKGSFIYYSVNSPLIQYNPKTNVHRPLITDYYGLDHTCMDATIDNEGSIWAATLRGAFRIKNPSIYNYNSEVLLENEVSALYEQKNGDLILGSNTGISVLHSDKRVTKYKMSNGLEKFRVMDIVEHDSEIYFTTYSGGVQNYANGNTSPLTTPTKLLQVSDLHSYDGELYCSNKGDLYQLQHGDWKLIYSTAEQETIRKFMLDENHQLLLTENGIYDIENGEHYTGDDLYMDNVYTATIYNRQILVGSSAGLCVIKNGKIIKSNYKIPGPIYALQVDDNNELWAGTDGGVWHLSDDGLANYHKGNGLIGNEVNRNAFSFAKDGELLVGTDEGLSIIDPTAELTVPIPSIQVTTVEANQNPIEDFELSYLTNNLRFHFRSNSFYNIERLNYRYRLIGLTKEWEKIEFAEQNTALYPNLDPGKYQFEVQARIADGDWSKSAKSQQIIIHAAFFEAVWFRILFVLLVIAGLVGFYKYRSSALTQQKEELELRVLEKTKQLENRNKELIHTIEDLKAAQGQLIQSEKLASMGHLTSGIAHELNNPLNYIRGGAECIIRNLDELTSIIEKPKGKKEEIRAIMEESKMLAESIFEGATKSTSIVKSLGSFTADSQNFFSFTDLQKEVETSLTLLNNEIGFRIIVNKMFANIPQIECYPAKINQMLVNILLNSIQAIKDRGEITIRYYRKDDQRIALEISDDGEGVSTDLHEKVFEPFFTTKDSNPGLGLTIAKSIVQEHNGTITFISKPGLGTKVKIYLPVSQTYHPELEDTE